MRHHVNENPYRRLPRIAAGLLLLAVPLACAGNHKDGLYGGFPPSNPPSPTPPGTDPNDEDDRNVGPQAPEPPEYCTNGQGIPDRIIEITVPATSGFSGDDLGYPLTASFGQLRGVGSPVFDRDTIVYSRSTPQETRSQVLGFHGTQERLAHVTFGKNSAGISQDGTQSGNANTLFGNAFNFSFTDTNKTTGDYGAAHSMFVTEERWVNDVQSVFDWSKIGPSAVWYLYKISWGHSVDVYGQENGKELNFDLSFGVNLQNPLGSGGPGIQNINFGFQFKNESTSNSASLQTLLRGFEPKTPELAVACLTADTWSTFQQCYKQTASAPPVMFTLRNIPLRCVPNNDRIERRWPLDAKLYFDSIEVIDAGANAGDWILSVQCRMDQVDLAVQTANVSFQDVSAGLYPFELQNRNIASVGAIPGMTLRCGVKGNSNSVQGTSTQNSPIRYSEFAEVIPEIVSPEQVTGTFGFAGEGAKYEISYRIEYTRENSI